MWKKVNECAIGFGVCVGVKLVATSVQCACFARVGEAMAMRRAHVLIV